MSWCHALRMRFTGAVADSVWVQEVPVPSDHPAAARRRAAELARPARELRRVLLRYTDGVQDLVIVARHDRYDAEALRRIASGDVPAPRTSEVVIGPLAAVPSWGLGEGTGAGVHEISVPAGGDERSWLLALSTVLHRYDPESGTAFAGLLYQDVELPGEYIPCLAPVFPLTIAIFPAPDSWRLRCDYLRSQFAPEIVSAFVRHLVHVHRQILGGTSVTHVELMDADELARVVALGRPDTGLVTTPTTVHDAFRQVVAANPDAIALCDNETRLTYAELNTRASAFAGGLRDRGVCDGDRVGVCLERTTELVVTLLGVLKAGATYVPMDPAYPAERLAYTVADAGLRVVVTRKEDFPASDGVRVVSPDVLASATSVVTAASPDYPAYVIYTSGSTGRPKGVVVPHRNVISLVDATRDEYRFGGEDVWTLFHSSAFDFSVWEIWGCLLTGGRLVVVPYFVSREPADFRDLLAAESVTVLSQTPSAFAQLLAVTGEEARSVRLVVFGGEPLDTRMLLPWLDRYRDCRLVNMFGITETTVHVTATTITRADALAASRSVGPALPGWHLYVVDAKGRIVPPGVAGEIVVGGAGVASRYLGREDLTAQRFRPDPAGEGIVYRSGDLGRLRPDGALEHLGRIDSQVKIRGFRIELDEIRAVLLEDPDVRAAAVVVRRANPANPLLDAYVVLTGGHSGAVRKRAANVLPEHMVPATVTAVNELPLTTNGKLDEKRLPAPAAPVVTVPAGDGAVERLVAIWTDVLGVPVGLDDDFFELGGNSLAAVRIGAAMRAAGLASVRLRELYRHPTVRAVAALTAHEQAG